MRALSCFSRQAAAARLHSFRGLRRRSLKTQDGLPVPGKASQAKTLQRGIEYERSSGLKNLLGAKIHFGAFLVDQLQQLSDRCSGHTARTFRQLSEEGRAYARWDAEHRARHLDQVQSALGAMDWEEAMLPSPASQPAEPAAVSMRKPSIAPHLRAQMAASESSHAHGNRGASAASISRAHDSPELPSEQWLHLSGVHRPQQEVPISAWQGDERIDVEDMVSDSRPVADSRHLQAQTGHVPHRELASAVGQISSEDVAAHALEDSHSSAGSEAWDAASDVSLQDRSMRGALRRAQNGHIAPGESITLEEASPASVSINSFQEGGSSSASSAGSDLGGGASAVDLQGRSVRGIVFDLETTGFPSKQNYILEIAAEDLESGEKWGTLVRIPEKVPVTNSYVHGITKPMVSDPSLPTMREAGQQFLDFMQRHCSPQEAMPLLIAHNGRAFDIRFIHLELERNNLALPDGALFFDTCIYARQIFPQINQPLPGYRQAHLREHFGIPEPIQEHRADQDVAVLAAIARQLIQLGVHSSFEEVVEASLRDNATYAQQCSVVNKRTGPTRAELLAQRARKAAAEGIVGDEDPLLTVESRHRPTGRVQRNLSRLLSSSSTISSSAASVEGLLQQRFVDRPKGFTDKQCKDLVASGFETIGDLLFFFPRDHISYGSTLQHDAYVHVHGTVLKATCRMARSLLIYEMEALVAALAAPEGDLGEVSAADSMSFSAGAAHPLPDAAGAVKVKGKKVISGFGAWGVKKKWEGTFSPGSPVILKGKASRRNGHWELDTATTEFLEPGSKRAEPADGPEPVYAQRAPLKAKAIPKLVAKALSALDTLPGAEDMDIIPEAICTHYNLMPWHQAVRSRHVPGSEQEAEAARSRLAFEELLVLQLRLLLQRTSAQAAAAEGEGVCMTDLAVLEAAREALGFQLTGGQEQALDNVLRDLEGPAPMMCLLQGDVGCGKTAVAFLAIMAAAGSGSQAAMMLPTEILAAQTHAKLQALLQRMPADLQPRAAILTGSTRARERREINAGIADGSIDILVGTHALISESVQFNSLGLAVVDEQHRFGVEQRARLAAKATPPPHVMYMTATPIPRTLALCEHGDLALYVIDELPPGRQPVTTRVITDSPEERGQVYKAMQEELADGGRAYIICPLVGESSAKGFTDTKAAEEEHKRLTEGGVMGPDVRYGLLHGRLSSEEKAAALDAFARGDTNVLIATTVVEVGVDVPEATVMVVEGAERFGLAALHQLRGRVGRGTRASSCFLICAERSERLAILEQSHNGFRIAEADLIHRGPGDFLGKKQSGRDAFSSLKSARLPQDRQLLEEARRTAATLCAEWRDGEADPPAPLLAAVHKQAQALLDIRQVALPAATVEALDALQDAGGV